MSMINRRGLLKAGAIASIAATTGGFTQLARSADDKAAAAAGAAANAAAGKDVTRTLARYIVNARHEDLPEKVRKEGTRL